MMIEKLIKLRISLPINSLLLRKRSVSAMSVIDLTSISCHKNSKTQSLAKSTLMNLENFLSQQLI